MANASPAAQCEVELDIFSGRPNPRWSLSPQECTTLQERLAGLPPTTKAATEPPGLGYRGLIVHRTDGPKVKVYGGHAAARQSDAGRQLERWLLETGRAHLEPAIFDLVLGELGKP
jgi:hypothetical protein